MELTCVLSVAAASLAAWSLTRSACGRFDACLDRPRIAASADEAIDDEHEATAAPLAFARPRTRLRSTIATTRRG
jgi:hypothetical protein